MSACRPEVQNVRHEMSGPTCRQHVGRHVGDMVQKRVAEGTDMTHPNIGFCDMSAPCWRMHKTYSAPAENRTRGPTMATLDFTTKPLD
jgi:hypothetical protein